MNLPHYQHLDPIYSYSAEGPYGFTTTDLNGGKYTHSIGHFSLDGKPLMSPTTETRKPGICVEFYRHMDDTGTPDLIDCSVTRITPTGETYLSILQTPIHNTKTYETNITFGVVPSKDSIGVGSVTISPANRASFDFPFGGSILLEESLFIDTDHNVSSLAPNIRHHTDQGEIIAHYEHGEEGLIFVLEIHDYILLEGSDCYLQFSLPTQTQSLHELAALIHDCLSPRDILQILTRLGFATDVRTKDLRE